MTVRNIGRIPERHFEKIKDLLWALGIMEHPDDSATSRMYSDMIKTREVYTVKDLQSYGVSRGGVYKIMQKLQRYGLVEQEARSGEELGLKAQRWVRVFRARDPKRAFEDIKQKQKIYTKQIDELVSKIK